MKTFKDKVAVITGAGSGIGRAMAHRCVQEGMKVILADVEGPALVEVETEMREAGAAVLAVRTDVSREADVAALAEKTIARFGSVHLLCNNAGVVGTVTPIWKSSPLDWQWVLGVNLWGVIHGIRVFVPIMLEQDTECHIANTASMAALIFGPGGVYGVSKHAVVGLSETLTRELAQVKSKIAVSVFCPGFVDTRIMDSERNRPQHLHVQPEGNKENLEYQRLEQVSRKKVQSGISAQKAADFLFEGIKRDQFYILTPPDLKDLIRCRTEDILQGRRPSY